MHDAPYNYYLDNVFKIFLIPFIYLNSCFKMKLTGKTFETIDPRTEEVITRIAEGDKEDIDIAVKAAREAFDHGSWPRLPACVSEFY